MISIYQSTNRKKCSVVRQSVSFIMGISIMRLMTISWPSSYCIGTCWSNYFCYCNWYLIAHLMNFHSIMLLKFQSTVFIPPPKRLMGFRMNELHFFTIFFFVPFFPSYQYPVRLFTFRWIPPQKFIYQIG